MPTIANTNTATTGNAVTVTSVDPVVDVTETGGILAIDAYGIVVESEEGPYSADITVNGIVSVFGLDVGGIWFRDNGGSVSIGEGGVVRVGGDFSFGIVSFVFSTVEQNITNAGQVIGDLAISLGAAGDSIDNSGTIRALGGLAINTQDGDDTVTNSGKIIGSVILGEGDDKFIAKAGGTVDGTIFGGPGDDKYWIVDNTLTLADISGTDKILSTVSHTLGADFENLTLMGQANIKGTGNASQNVMYGNNANNKLKGYGGDDTLDGRKGNDKLFGGNGDDTMDGGRGNDIYKGGDGADTFVFSTGSDRDKIKDFDAASGAEDIDLSGLASVTGFSDLKNNHMAQVGGNVVIDGGSGDVLTLVRTDIGDLDASDFLF